MKRLRKGYLIRFFGVITLCFLVVLTVLPLFFNKSEKSEKSEQRAEQSRAVYLELARTYSQEIPSVKADSAIVIDMDSRSVLYQKSADVIRGMASTTKIMTALIAIENGNPDQEFLIPKNAVGIEGSSVYLSEGEPLTLRELLYCLLLESGNDAATAIAICVGGSEEAFIKMMNERASELGLEHTNFTNPHGLSDPDHHTTARELAIITAEAMQETLFREICATKAKSVRRDGIENARTLTNHNKLLTSFDGANGVKTGYTERDGKCLVSSATRDGLTVIAVTLDDPSPTATHAELLNKSLTEFSRVRIAKAGEIKAVIPINNGSADFITATNTADVFATLPRGQAFKIELSSADSVDAPVDILSPLATATVTAGGKEVYIINLESTEEIEVKKGFFDNLIDKFFGE